MSKSIKFNRYISNIIIKYFNSFLFDFIEKYKDKINWIALSENTNIPYTFFEKYLEDPKYKDKINWYNLSQKIKFYNIDEIRNSF